MLYEFKKDSAPSGIEITEVYRHKIVMVYVMDASHFSNVSSSRVWR